MPLAFALLFVVISYGSCWTMLRSSSRSFSGHRAKAMSESGQDDGTQLIDDIVSFWFGKSSFSRYDTFASQSELWCGGGQETDDLIRNSFGSLTECALSNELDHLLNHKSRPARGDLSLIIMLDQFPRNIYRRHAKAFSGDAKSREIVQSVLEPERWKIITDILPPVVCMWFIIPLMHQESLEDVNRCVDALDKMAQQLEQEGEQASDCAKKVRRYQAGAKQHRDIIVKFGRYPHRNEVLQRQPTEEEVEFIKNGPRFGQ